MGVYTGDGVVGGGGNLAQEMNGNRTGMGSLLNRGRFFYLYCIVHDPGSSLMLLQHTCTHTVISGIVLTMFGW